MAAGVRSLLAFWSGGAGALTPTTQAGVRGLLAPWMGGAGAGGVTQAGVKGLLAFWMGGAVPGAAREDTGGGLFPLRDFGAPLREQIARRRLAEIEEQREAAEAALAAIAAIEAPALGVEALAALLPVTAARETVSPMVSAGDAGRLIAARRIQQAKDEAEEAELAAIMWAALEAMDD